MVHADTVTYIYTDPQGTPLAEADATGTITARFDYAPYGMASTASGMAGAPNGPGYTGHVNDSDTGLVYMQARYYDPSGRFLSPDPVEPTPGNLFSFNRYAYASNNPIINMDPDGRDTVGENIDENAQAAADAGNNFATYGWALAGVAWSVFGAEPVSQVADKGTAAGTGNMVMAVVTVVTLGKGEEAATAAKEVGQGIEDVAKNVGRAKNKLGPVTEADAAHSTFKTGADGKISNTATYEPNAKNPSGFQETKRVDVTGKSHTNPDGKVIPTPHVKEPGTPGVRPANPNELPSQ
jgi:RHS repeat-associated protein